MAVEGSDNSALFGSFAKALYALANIERSKHNGPKREPRKLSNPCTTRAESGHRFLRGAKQNIRRYLANAVPREGVRKVSAAMFLESSRLFTPSPPLSCNLLKCQLSWRSSNYRWRTLFFAVGFPDTMAGSEQILSAKARDEADLRSKDKFPNASGNGSVFQVTRFR